MKTAEYCDVRRRIRETIRRSIEARQRSDAARKRAEELAKTYEKIAASLSLAQTRQKDRIQKQNSPAK